MLLIAAGYASCYVENGFEYRAFCTITDRYQISEAYGMNKKGHSGAYLSVGTYICDNDR